MKKTAIIAAALAVVAFGGSAQAQIVNSSTGTLNTTIDGVNETLDIAYQVYLASNIYTYDYQLTSSAVLTQFSIALGAPVFDVTGDSSIVSQSNTFLDVNLTPNDTASVSFESLVGPGLNSWGVDDEGGAWSNPPLIASPVPEPSTIAAGALMLLPLGIGAIRAIRKERVA